MAKLMPLFNVFLLKSIEEDRKIIYLPILYTVIGDKANYKAIRH